MSSEEQRDGATTSNGQHLILPTFTSIAPGTRSSVAGRSTPSSSKTRSLRSSRQEENVQRPASSDHHAELPPVQPNGEVHRRSRQRGSGGFLLDDAEPSRRLSKTLLSRSLRGTPEKKGKRKSEIADLKVTKRRAPDHHREQDGVDGGSPLHTEVFRNGDTAERRWASNHSEMSGSRHSTSSYMSGALREMPLATNARNVSTPNPYVPPPRMSDANSAQIVNLALSLSDARRRQASGRRSTSAAIGKQRVPSVQMTTGSVKEYVEAHHRPVSREAEAARPTSRQMHQSPDTVDDIEEAEIEDESDEASMVLSAATIKRVERAKNFFELAYQHRRLLSHLPPLRNPETLRSPTDAEGQSRIYNPLQYARNRKLRFRNREPIHTEQEGWHEIAQVKDWVNAVIVAHTETRHDPDECIRLPDLAQTQHPRVTDDEDDIEMMSPDSFDRRDSKKDIKPYRPRQDWKFHPGDLIADVHWLEQGLNKTKIENRDGNRVYPEDIKFKFSGWRRGIPLAAVPSNFQQPTPSPEPPARDDPEERVVHTERRELPIFTSATQDNKPHKGHPGGLGKIKKSIASKSKKDNGLAKSRSKLFHLADSDSSSTASDSDDTELRGRRKRSRKRAFEIAAQTEQKDLRRMHTATTVSDSFDPSSLEYDESYGQSPPASKRGSLDSGRIHQLFTRDSTKAKTPLRLSKSRSESTRRGARRPRISVDSERGPRSSGEYDETLPSSPSVPEFPSIAINLSPPHSREPSPGKKSLPSRLNLFRDRSKQRNGIETNDFGFALSNRGSRQGSDEARANHSSSNGSRGTSPMTRGRSPFTIEPQVKIPDHEPTHYNPLEHGDSNASKVSNKSLQSHAEHHGRIRGMFKGGRIAELVGNEVSRVGDFVFKRDAPGGHKVRGSTSTASLPDHHRSDTEDEDWGNGTVVKTPNKHMRYQSTASASADKISPTLPKSSPSLAEQNQHYNNPNLPVFSSPFQKDKEKEEARQDAKQQDILDPNRLIPGYNEVRSQSAKGDRLGLPRLDTSRPSSPSGLKHRDSYGFGSYADLSRSRNASQVFNQAITGFPATGLIDLKPTRSGSSFGPGANNSQQSPVLAAKGPVTTSDLTISWVKLASSAIKAREIARRADLVRDPTPQWLLDTLGPANQSDRHPPYEPIRVKRRDEHIVAARNLFATLASEADTFHARLRRFRETTSPNLHSQLQRMEDMVESTLTPRVQTAADEAGELGMKLATTSTLAMKEVNDQIASAIRMRRRGPVRLLRNLGYKLIEMGVVGLLWAIWLVVTMIRVVLGMGKGAWRVAKWVVWAQ